MIEHEVARPDAAKWEERVKEHGILFTAPMVRALLAGTKTQTRRIAKAPKGFTIDGPIGGALHCIANIGDEGDAEFDFRHVEAPHGPVGRRLWVRETWAESDRETTLYRADADLVRDDSGERDGWWLGERFLPGRDRPFRWTPAIHMPRSRSRIMLEVTRVRLERVQSITEEDARAEGMDWAAPLPQKVDRRRKFADDREDPREVGYASGSFARQNYAALWDTINGAGSWASNPWVWVYDFRRATGAG